MSKFDELVCKKIADYLDKSMFQIVIRDEWYKFSQIVIAESISEAFNIWKNYVKTINTCGDDGKRYDFYDIIDEILSDSSFHFGLFKKCDKNGNEYIYVKYADLYMLVEVVISKIGSYPISLIIKE
jgi:hypothetical protein